MEAEKFASLLKRLSMEECASANTLHLTANENVLSHAASAFVAGSLYGRYHLGHANKREIARYATTFSDLLLKSLSSVHEVEHEALRASRELFGAAYADFRPLSGVHAIISTLSALTSPDDVVYCLRPSEAGHFATSQIINRLGRHCCYLPWNSDMSDLDLDETKNAFSQRPPDAIYLDHSGSLFPLNINGLRTIAGEEVLIIYDGSHPLGLIAGKSFGNPLEEGADVLQGSTHKTFPGPQKAIVMTRSADVWQRFGQTMDSFVSSQHSGDTIALCVSMLEMEIFACQYAAQIVKNSQALAESLAEKGFKIYARNGDFPISHQVLLLGFESGENLLSAQKLLECGISVNSKTALGKSIIRIGVQESTRRGMTEMQMSQIADIIARALIDREGSDGIRSDVSDLVRRHQNVEFSFDSMA
jgi:glycine/serine hydroxymethyltransferase